jgi:hypothetical protein
MAEHHVKAASLYIFARFVEWPAEACSMLFTATPPSTPYRLSIHICLHGPHQVALIHVSIAGIQLPQEAGELQMGVRS